MLCLGKSGYFGFTKVPIAGSVKPERVKILRKKYDWQK